MRVPLFVKILIPVILLFTVLGLGFVGWAKQVYEAEEEPLALARANEKVVITDTAQYIWIKPEAVTSNALIFYPGAKVDPHAYLWKLSDISIMNNLQIFITKPGIKMAIFGIRQADIVRKDFPEVSNWYVGGHSLGGAMACFYAKQNPELAGVILFGSYCSTDISDHEGRFLSITGGRDDLTSSDTVNENRSHLPASAVMREIPGMNHAQVGDYGQQDGDTPASISDEEVKEALSGLVLQFFVGVK